MLVVSGLAGQEDYLLSRTEDLFVFTLCHHSHMNFCLQACPLLITRWLPQLQTSYPQGSLYEAREEGKEM